MRVPLGKINRWLPSRADENKLLPKSHDYYRFNGSLTTLPCSEGVWCLVMKTTETASKEKIKKFTGIMGHPNNRPMQLTNARVIVQ
ncbi:MAG: carbonic anhydrase family protein [Pseudomonadales bacterium]|nr:carbonic anhydrase family protein [Pseudomonadales bacterium]